MNFRQLASFSIYCGKLAVTFLVHGTSFSCLSNFIISCSIVWTYRVYFHLCIKQINAISCARELTILQNFKNELANNHGQNLGNVSHSLPQRHLWQHKLQAKIPIFSGDLGCCQQTSMFFYQSTNSISIANNHNAQFNPKLLLVIFQNSIGKVLQAAPIDHVCIH